jgi:hypothetical protein
MFRSLKVSVVALALIVGSTQTASAREFADIYTQCGLGAMIAPTNQAVAVCTNITWDSGTTAISSNALSPDTCKGGKAKTALFIHDSYDQLEKQLASGQGSYVNSLTTLAGVSSEKAAGFQQQLRSDFAKLVAQPGYTQLSKLEKSAALYELVYTS